MSEATISEQAAAIIDLIPRIMRRLSAIDDDPAMELPLAQLRVCGVLQDGPRAMSALSQELGITHSATTQLANRLERAGLVERVAESGDRRVKCLQLTPRGAEIMRTRREKRVARAEEALAALRPDARAAIVSALESLAAATGSGPGECAGSSIASRPGPPAND